jgi:SPP1 gp7 family putative phage head morphogenesis protein
VDNRNYQSTVKTAVKGKFKGRKAVRCKYIQRYPSSAEREYKRITRRYVKVLNRTLKENLPDILSSYGKDDAQSFRTNEKTKVYAMSAELEETLNEFGLYDAVDSISRITQNNSIREWKRAVRDTLGVDILDDYYRGELYEQLIKQWIADNALALKSAPLKAVMNIDAIIMEGYNSGKTIPELQQEIMNSYKKTKWWFAAMAAGQVAMLNAKLTRMEQEDSGVKRYWWSSSKDERVRDCHRAFEGHVYSWDNPPEDWHMTKTKGIVYTGKRYHPGEAYGCRCCAIPVFDWDTIDLPMKGMSDEKFIYG